MQRTVFLMVAALALAGCIEAPADPDAAMDEVRAPAAGSMDAEERSEEAATLCTNNIGLDNEDRFCATRTVTVTGTISGIPRLDVDLQTFNGDVELTKAAPGKWGFVATLKARGPSADAALARLDDIDFSWGHESGEGHFLEVVAKHEDDGDNDGLGAEIRATMAPQVAALLVATTANGDVTLQGVQTEGAALTTSNGKIVASGEVTQVAFTTSNGDVDATLTPGADARWLITTSNGKIGLKVPETSDVGYDIEGTTSNGEVDYSMRDGKEGECPQGSQYYTPPCNHRTFETNGYARRATQVRATLTSSNGDITVASS